MKFLVIDDEPLIRRSLCKAGRLRGHEMLEAGDGAKGLAIWRGEWPDLVFLDVLMPGLNGGEVLQRAKEFNGLATPVVLMSAYAGEMDQAAFAEAKLFLPKPFADIFLVIEQGENLVTAEVKIKIKPYPFEITLQHGGVPVVCKVMRISTTGFLLDTINHVFKVGTEMPFATTMPAGHGEITGTCKVMKTYDTKQILVAECHFIHPTNNLIALVTQFMLDIGQNQ
jgi:CheY-like chemotaxis protein